MTILRKLALGTAAALAAAASPAAAQVTISGAVTGISVHGVDPGLVITAAPIAFPVFSLSNVGDFQDYDVLTIGTGEDTVNTDFLSLFGEDTVPYPVSATFSFASPTGASGSPVTGTTFGFIAPLTSCGILAGGCGQVDWGGASEFTFGDGGKFSVQLFDATFGTPGNATVKGRFTLLANGVPEPATWAMLLIGFGAVGATLRARNTNDRTRRLRVA